VQIFREVIGLTTWDDTRLLAEPLDALKVDSLTLLDFVMQVEDAYDVALDEDAVQRCRTIGELAEMVAAERNRQVGEIRPPRLGLN